MIGQVQDMDVEVTSIEEYDGVFMFHFTHEGVEDLMVIDTYMANASMYYEGDDAWVSMWPEDESFSTVIFSTGGVSILLPKDEAKVLYKSYTDALHEHYYAYQEGF